MLANVYVDGFNLYYSALRHRFTDCKWLDPRTLAEIVFPNDTIQRVRYFTARISARPDNPSRRPASRRTCAPWLRPAWTSTSDSSGTTAATEEKGSDVNLATYLLRDAALNDCELAIVLTNDTDLLEPIRLVRSEFGLQVMLVSPVDTPSSTLLGSVDGVKKLRRGPLQACQLPTNLSDAKGDTTGPEAGDPALETLKPAFRRASHPGAEAHGGVPGSRTISVGIARSRL